MENSGKNNQFLSFKSRAVLRSMISPLLSGPSQGVNHACPAHPLCAACCWSLVVLLVSRSTVMVSQCLCPSDPYTAASRRITMPVSLISPHLTNGTVISHHHKKTECSIWRDQIQITFILAYCYNHPIFIC